MQQLLNVRLLPIQLLQSVNRIGVRRFWTVDSARFLVLVEDSEGGRNCQGIAVIIHVAFILIKVGKTSWLLVLGPRYLG